MNLFKFVICLFFCCFLGFFILYFIGFYFWGVAASIVLFLKLLTLVTKPKNGSMPCISKLVLAPTFLLLVFIAGFGWRDYKKSLDSAMGDPGKFYVSEFGGFLDVAYRDYIDYARQHREYNAVEDYWGLWNSLNRSFPPWPVDSVIHALGGVRELSKASLKDADLIITTRYLTSPSWQSWNLSQNFWFYEDLISQWEPNFISPTTVVWKRSYVRSAYEAVECRVSSDKRSIKLSPARPGFYRVVLNYSSSGVGRYLLMFKNNISDGADAAGFLSLQPGTHKAIFPVLITQEGDKEFFFNPTGEVAVGIFACAAERILYQNDELLHERKPENFFLTDGNWIHGIARRWAGFFTHNSSDNRSKFKKGSVVMFQNGERRTVISVSENGPYLNVWVNGQMLRPEDVGLPNKFQVLQ